MYYKEAAASKKPQQHPGGKGSPMGSPCGPAKYKQPTLRSFIEMRNGLQGSQRQAGDKTTSKPPAKGTGGRDLPAQAKTATKGRIGEGARRGGRIRKVGGVPGPMDQFVEKIAAHEAPKEATDTRPRREKRQKGWEKEGGTREGPGGCKEEKEKEM